MQYIKAENKPAIHRVFVAKDFLHIVEVSLLNEEHTTRISLCRIFSFIIIPFSVTVSLFNRMQATFDILLVKFLKKNEIK